VNEVDHVVIPLAGIALPTILVPTIMLLKHGQQKRQWRHQERMQAFASGLPAPPTNSPPGAGAIIAIGAGVPFFAVFAALIVTMNSHRFAPHQLEHSAIAWGCAVVISMGALATGLILAALQYRAHAKSYSLTAPPDEPYGSSKPAYDPDAFDVVSRRG
jgi:hypothetical protein